MNYFWAKTTKDSKPGISVMEHMTNVGYVACSMAALFPDLLRLFQINSQSVGALAALHDLGKVSPGFQRKCEEWLRQENLLEIARRWNWEQEMEPDHGKVTHAVLQGFFNEKGTNENASNYLSTVLGGHHGRLSPPSERGFRTSKAIVEGQSGINWEEERRRVAEKIVSEFGIDLSKISIDDSSAGLWWLAGLTSVADWIGSDERYFPAEGRQESKSVRETAIRCLNEIGFVKHRIVKGLSFQDLFDGNDPYDMQQEALSTITDRGVYVIEAPMGMGKTEAALGAAYHLLCDGKASGIYFALPTQATSNRMHVRMEKFVRKIAPDTVGPRIIHGNSWLLDNHPPLSPTKTSDAKEEDAQVGRDWFSSAKRALIAPFGVGTVDQALLGIVAAKHFFVRHFALAGKVVILDEIHSYDLYTGTLVDRLIDTLEKLGCTVIVLSATLSQARRKQIIPSPNDPAVSPSKEPYPLITGRRDGKTFQPVAAEPPKPREVDVEFKSEGESISLGIGSAAIGACVIWVSDTVEGAQATYKRIVDMNRNKFPVGLLHSRFPYWRREELENEWMNRFGKDGSTRCGSILVSTQIVEQSVDLDADLMITELAPTDMMLQRLGRMWRHHDRDNDRPVSKPQLVIIEEKASIEDLRKMDKKEIPKVLGDKALVYDPYVLLRSLEQWKKRKKINIPIDIRRITEATYKDRIKELRTWKGLIYDLEGKRIALRQKALMSSNIWQVALNDEEGVQTRLNELPTLSLILSRSFSKNTIELLNGTNCKLDNDVFQLPTAQALHRNLVRVPEYHFGKVAVPDTIAKYVHGKCAVAIVDDDGAISVDGLKDDVALRWDIDLGLVIEKEKGDK